MVLSFSNPAQNTIPLAAMCWEGKWVAREAKMYLADPFGEIIRLREFLDVVGDCARSPVEEGGCGTFAACEWDGRFLVAAGEEFHCRESLDALCP